MGTVAVGVSRKVGQCSYLVHARYKVCSLNILG